MKTNQKGRPLRLITLAYLLFFTNSAIGQNLISDILHNGETVFQTDIYIKKPNEASKSKLIQLDDPIDSAVTIHVIDPQITVVIKTSNGTEVRIPGSNILTFEITKTKEKYDLIQGTESSSVIIDKLKEFTGSVITTGKTSRLQARTRGTKFSLKIDGEELDVKVERGELEVIHLIKREIKDDVVPDNDNKRGIFIRTTSQLKAEDQSFRSNYIKNENLLANDKEIKKFLIKQYNIQKKVLISKGRLSKSAFKEININETDKGILFFENAIKSGELDTDLIVQSAFLFADSYLYKGDREKSKTWLEAGLHFSKLLYDENQKNLKIDDDSASLLKNNETNLKEIDKAITNVLRYDMITANEFSAWGYDIKLRLNGCLENSNENPGKYRNNALNLIEQIQKAN